MTRTQPGPAGGRPAGLEDFKSNAFPTRAPAAAELRVSCRKRVSICRWRGEVSHARRLGVRLMTCEALEVSMPVAAATEHAALASDGRSLVF